MMNSEQAVGRQPTDHADNEAGRRMAVSADALKAECLKNKYIKLLSKPDVYPSRTNWEYIISHRMEGVGQGLYRKYLVSFALDEDSRSDYHELALKMFPEYLKVVSHGYAVEVVYSDLESDIEAAVTLAKECNLHDAARLRSLVASRQVDIAIELMESFQPEYTEYDLRTMEALLHDLHHLPQSGRIVSSSGMFGGGRKFVCEFGHENPDTAEFCRREDCGIDIYGLTRAQHAVIDEYASRIEALRNLLGK